MEQTTSQPAYLYIPEPIEQQLAGYTLGPLLEVYKTGWDGHSNRKPKFRMFLFNLVLLAVLVISIIIIFYALRITGILVLGLILIPFFAIIGLGVGIPLLLKASLCVGAFSNGFVYAKNTQVTVLTWKEIGRFEQKTIKNLVGTLRVLTISARDGRIFQVKGPYLQVDDLSKIIRENVV